jgi:hypothetical protein
VRLSIVSQSKDTIGSGDGCTYQLAQLFRASATFNEAVDESEVKRWTRSSLDAAVRLEVEVLEVGQGHTTVDPCSRVAVVVSTDVCISSIHRVESCVVALDAYHGGKHQLLAPEGRVAILFQELGMSSPNGFDFNIKDLSVLACSKRVRLAIVSDTHERVVMFLTFRYAIAVVDDVHGPSSGGTGYPLPVTEPLEYHFLDIVDDLTCSAHTSYT